MRGKFIISLQHLDHLGNLRAMYNACDGHMILRSRTFVHTSPSPSSFPYPLTSSYQGTNGSQLWDSAFAAQAFLEVRTKKGCVVKVHDQRGRDHMVCVMTSRMGKTTAAANQTEDGDWSGDYRGPLLDGWYVCMNGRTVSASI